MSRRSRRSDEGRDEKQSVGVRGRAGLDKVDDEVRAARERAKNSFSPFRYKAAWDGTLNELIILDHSLNDAFFFHEHAVPNSDGRWGSKFEVCVREFANCPLCRINEDDHKKIGRSNYTMVLTVLDLRPFKKKDGTKVEYARRMFVVKGQALQKWRDRLKEAEEMFGTLRGVYMQPERNAKKESAVGLPAPLMDDWYGELPKEDKYKPFSIVEEDDLIENYGNKAKKGDDGKVFKPKNEDITPYVYDELFTMPDIEELARKYSGKYAEDEAESRRGWDDDEDDQPKRRRRSRRQESDDDEDDGDTRTRKRSRSRKDEDEDDAPKRRTRRTREVEEDDGEEEEMPRARRRKKSGDAPPPPRRTKDEPDEEEESEEGWDGEGDDAEEKPARRRTRGTKSGKSSSRVRTRSRKAEPDDDDPEDDYDAEDEDEDEPPKTRSRRRAPADDLDEDEIPF